jgi:hypothetical protein
MHKKEGLAGAAILFLLCSCGSGAGAPTPAAAGPPDLVDEARERGLVYVNRSGTAAKDTVLEANGAGVALIDLGGDGDLDVVFAQGLGSLAQAVAGPGADLEVFVNDGAGRFARAPGPGLAGWWTGPGGRRRRRGRAPGPRRGRLRRPRPPPPGRERPARAEGGRGPAPRRSGARLAPGAPRAPGHPPMWVTSVALFDADRDGRLDLYACQYVDLDPLAPPAHALGEGPLAVPCQWKGYWVFCGPSGMVAQADRILRGKGDGTFEERTAAWLPGVPAGYALGVLPFDADGDGDTDLFVANDSTPNLLLVNDGRGVFADRAYAAGVALSADGRAQAGMGAACGDVDRDGVLDLAVTNFSDEATELYFGSARGFTQMTYRYGLLNETRRLLSWGVHLADLDGDGWLELFTVNGHVYPQADLEHTGTSYGQPATLWRLGPEKRALRVVAASERSVLAPAIGARGTALGDVDQDGAPDLVIARIDAPAALAMNRTGPGNHRLALRLLGPEHPSAGEVAPGERRTPPDGMGARAVVVVGRGRDEHGLLGEVQTACGYQSASSAWLAFGLGAAERYESIRLRWPSGRIEDLPAGPAGRRLTVREGQGIVREEPFR